jgi:hypothetical protein
VTLLGYAVKLYKVTQNYAFNIYRHLFEKFRYPIHRRGCFHLNSVIHLVRLGTAIRDTVLVSLQLINYYVDLALSCFRALPDVVGPLLLVR